jgi:predicted DNA-binding transcriptional regulator AlpA
MQTQSEKFLTQNELAEMWGVSPNTLRKWRWEGKGPRFVKLGTRVVYRQTDIFAFTDQGLRNSTSDAGGIHA